jgi:hypothetical protein
LQIGRMEVGAAVGARCPEAMIVSEAEDDVGCRLASAAEKTRGRPTGEQLPAIHSFNYPYHDR